MTWKIEADLVGYISILHLRIADLDLKGPSCDECLLLAEKASHAVDFQKTGTPVNFDNLPRAGRLRPDFLTGEVVEPSAESSFYPSDKVLGILYRNVPLKNEDAIHEESVFGTKIWESVTRVARRAEVRFGLPSINDHPDELLDEIHATMMAYSEQLMEIAKAHTQSRIPGDYLTEPELVSGTIQGKWHDHRKRRETVASMELQVSSQTRPHTVWHLTLFAKDKGTLKIDTPRISTTSPYRRTCTRKYSRLCSRYRAG